MELLESIKHRKGANMIDVTKADWKLFCSRIGGWQEAYIDKLLREYIALLQKDGTASEKFWELEKRIKSDKCHPGVQMELRKQDVPFNLVQLMNLGVITEEELEGFSEKLRDTIKFLISRNYGKS